MPELAPGPDVAPLGPADIREIAGRIGLSPAKRLGQNFVIDAGTVNRITALAAVRPVRQCSRSVPASDRSPCRFSRRPAGSSPSKSIRCSPPSFRSTIAARAARLAGRLEVVTADAARVAELPGSPPTALVANLPYNVAVPVVLHLLATFPAIGRGLVMVQAEVADRMSAAPGSRIYGVPSVKLAWFAEVRRAGSVPRSVFWPVPRVDSGLVAFTRRDPPVVPGSADDGQPSRAEVFRVVDAAFSQRRKTLRAALASWAGSPAAAERVLRAAGVDPGLRGESLGVAEFSRIALAGRGQQAGKISHDRPHQQR